MTSMTPLGRTLFPDSSREERRVLEEVSLEPFDRLAFANRVLDLLHPRGMTIAVCESRHRLSVEAGRVWGKAPQRWAIVSVPPTASRRAIALAMTELSDAPTDPYVLDVLLGSETTPYR